MIENAVVVGTGKLAYSCAKMLLKRNMQCIVYEYGEYSYSNLELQCHYNSIQYSHVTKQELTQILFGIQEEMLIVSANNTYLFPANIVYKKNLHIINFHPALLPKHAGRNAEAWSIYEEDEKSGITWHWVDDKIDHGAIVVSEEILLDNNITSLKLMGKQVTAAENAFSRILPVICEDVGYFAERNEETKEKLHYAEDVPNNGIFNIEWAVGKMSAFLRAMDYGRLKVMGLPYCILENEKWIWDNYCITMNIENEITDIKQGIFANKEQIVKLENFRRKKE